MSELKRKRRVIFWHRDHGQWKIGHLIKSTLWNGEKRVVIRALPEEHPPFILRDDLARIFKKSDEGVLWAYVGTEAAAALEVAYALTR